MKEYPKFILLIKNAKTGEKEVFEGSIIELHQSLKNRPFAKNFRILLQEVFTKKRDKVSIIIDNNKFDIILAKIENKKIHETQRMNKKYEFTYQKRQRHKKWIQEENRKYEILQKKVLDSLSNVKTSRALSKEVFDKFKNVLNDLVFSSEEVPDIILEKKEDFFIKAKITIKSGFPIDIKIGVYPLLSTFWDNYQEKTLTFKKKISSFSKKDKIIYRKILDETFEWCKKYNDTYNMPSEKPVPLRRNSKFTF